MHELIAISPTPYHRPVIDELPVCRHYSAPLRRIHVSKGLSRGSTNHAIIFDISLNRGREGHKVRMTGPAPSVAFAQLQEHFEMTGVLVCNLRTLHALQREFATKYEAVSRGLVPWPCPFATHVSMEHANEAEVPRFKCPHNMERVVEMPSGPDGEAVLANSFGLGIFLPANPASTPILPTRSGPARHAVGENQA